MKKLNANEQKALIVIAKWLKVDPKRLYALIDFESSWNPLAKNPRSSARGLIQIIDSSAKNIGFDSSLDAVTKNPTRVKQLISVVYPYLKKHMPFSGDQSLFMSVFYPAAMNWPSQKMFPEVVRKNNPGINTPNDYLQFVYRKLNYTWSEKILGFIALSGLAVYLIYKNKVKRG